MFSDRSAINNPTQSGGTDGKSSIQRDWLGGISGGTRIEFVPAAAGGLGDFRRIYKDANGQDQYLDLQPNERVGNYSDSNRDAWRSRATRKADLTEARNLAADQRKIDADERAKNFKLLEGRLDNETASTRAQLLSIQAGITDNAGRLDLARTAQEGANTIAKGTLDLNRDVAQNQLTLGLAQIEQGNNQLKASNQLAASKLLLDDQHFQQQIELDKRNGRRTQVLGALSVIAQSAARL